MYNVCDIPVWPSTFATLSAFKNLIKDNYLKPSPNIDVKVENVDLDTSNFTVTTCQTCNELLVGSGLLESVSVV